MTNITYAEEMAKTAYNQQEEFGCGESEFWEDDKDHWIEMHLSLAHIAVEQRAEGVRIEYRKQFEGQHDVPDCVIDSRVEIYLKEQGLIPDTDQEAATDVTA